MGWGRGVGMYLKGRHRDQQSEGDKKEKCVYVCVGMCDGRKRAVGGKQLPANRAKNVREQRTHHLWLSSKVLI